MPNPQGPVAQLDTCLPDRPSGIGFCVPKSRTRRIHLALFPYLSAVRYSLASNVSSFYPFSPRFPRPRSRAPGMSTKRRTPPPPPDPDHGLWQGRSIARRFVSPDGWTVLVGRTAADNDVLSLKLGAARDFWFHIASGPGSHVVVRNPDKADRMPRATQDFAAALAARYSKAKAGGKVAVHLTTCDQVSKPRRFAAGKVTLGRHKTVYGQPSTVEGD